jgi:hypothetical protein
MPFNALKNLKKVVANLTKDKDFNLDEFIWVEKSRIDKKAMISEESKSFFREVFRYDPK